MISVSGSASRITTGHTKAFTSEIASTTSSASPNETLLNAAEHVA